jgi:hypothetical protein
MSRRACSNTRSHSRTNRFGHQHNPYRHIASFYLLRHLYRICFKGWLARQPVMFSNFSRLEFVDITGERSSLASAARISSAPI